ncbi:hypothetical protein, partial [Aurantimonas sp. C2-4-R8]|uniref:hypothetical protein n=1 Tax=Aurantimonas sp. C2-4-R8 TaxID=3114364 RepID=UPI002E179141
MRIMLLWSGIEGLLSVDGELTRRIALYSALMIEGSHDEKLRWFAEIKKAYGVRSKAVHGGTASKQILQDGYQQASRILVRLLVRCVELGRVPTPSELDAQTLRVRFKTLYHAVRNEIWPLSAMQFRRFPARGGYAEKLRT